MHNKHYFLLLAVVTYCTTTLAQPRIKDQGVVGGDMEDFFSSMALTKDGGLIAGGSSESNSSFEKTENSRGYYDYWVVKLDSNRTIQWNKTFGGNYTDELTVVQQTADGGYILGGYSGSKKSGDKTENSKGGWDYWIVKMDAAGNVQWDKTIGGSGIDQLYALQQTRDGGYVLGGYSSSKASGDKTENNKGYYDYWVVKLDVNGNIQWDKTIGGNNYDYLTALQQTTDDGYIVGGYSYSRKSGDKSQESKGYLDYWVVKLDGSGTIQWDKTIGGSDDDELYALQQTANGDYILGGYSYSPISGNKTEASKGYNDYWIVRINSKGVIQWDKTIGGDKSDVLTALQQTSDSSYIAAGYSSSGISGDKTENSRVGADYWIVKINGSGKVVWDKTIGGSGNDYAYAVREIKKNDFVIGGSSNSRISGDKTGGNRGGVSQTSDYWLVELKYVRPDSITTAPIATTRLTTPQQSNAFSIYPNPATTVLHIQNMGKATFILSDQGGKLMLIKTIEGNGELNVANIPAGTYYLTNTTTSATQTVVITK